MSAGAIMGRAASETITARGASGLTTMARGAHEAKQSKRMAARAFMVR